MVILPALLLLVIVVVVVAGLAFGAGPMASGQEGRRSGTRSIGILGPLAVAAGAVVFAVLVLGAVDLARSSSDGGDDGPDEAATPTASTVPRSSQSTATSAPEPEDAEPETAPGQAGPDGATPGLGPIVHLGGDVSTGAVGGLAPTTVLQVRVEGFDPYSVAHAEQCVEGRPRRCGNPLTVQFGEDGTASFQYLVTDRFAGDRGGGRCRADDPSCSIVVTATQGAGREELWTLFGDRLPAPGRVEVTPSTGINEGDTVTVDLKGFQPGTQAEVRLCAVPLEIGTERCGAPGPETAVRLDRRGRARVTIVIESGSVGTGRVPCDPSHRCAISVASDTAFVRSNAVPIVFAKPPGVDYEPMRLALGLGVALALLLLVVWLLRSTDWSAVGEAAAPEIDDAEYADLDALIALLPPEEEDVLA